MKGMKATGAVAVIGLLCSVASPVHPVVPSADRVEAAVAETNVAAGREQAIKLEMSLQIGERPGVASAELISHPTGLARLELRGSGNLVERHLLQGSELSAVRNGRPLEEPRTFLPPFFVLQSDTATTLRAALESFAVQVDFVGLAECGENDCLVVGDPERAVPRPELPPLAGLGAYESEQDAEAEETGLIRQEPNAGKAPSDRGEDDAERSPVAKLWVDARSFEVRGMDFLNGVRVRLGPAASFDNLSVPAWILIEEIGKAPARFDVLRASQVNAPASAFSRDWLMAPIEPDATSGPLDPAE
ncbi:MAG: hypothetical protein JRG92_18505 [Deltaproteobacteria bacterium]|nr:hypothetical protein [Deltaproteobacteria bacterium]